MTTRTHTNAVAFAHPFVLGDPNEVLPPGVNFIACRRVAVVFHLPSASADPAPTRTITLHPRELDAALMRDAVSPVGPAAS